MDPSRTEGTVPAGWSVHAFPYALRLPPGANALFGNTAIFQNIFKEKRHSSDYQNYCEIELENSGLCVLQNNTTLGHTFSLNKRKTYFYCVFPIMKFFVVCD